MAQGWRQVEPISFVSNWHIDIMADHLTAVADRQIKRLLVNLPPRHMKSMGANVFFPAWTWAQDPGKGADGKPLAIKPGTWRGPGVKFMHLSYAADISSRDSVKCRRLIDSRWYQERWHHRFGFTADQNQKLRFENTCGGHRISTSVGGRVTGDGADIIIFDDPHNVNDGESPVVREGVLRFWDETMQTRLNDPEHGVFMIIMQRVHEKDLSGHILASELGSTYTHLCIPAEYEPDHPFQIRTTVRRSSGSKAGKVWEDDRAPGEPLWPQRFTTEKLKEWGTAMGSYAAAGQLQQRPAPREGGIFKKSWFGEPVPAVPASAVVKVRAWDLAATEEALQSDPDYSVGVKMSRDPVDGTIYIEHVERFRASPLQTERRVKNLAGTDGFHVTIRIPQDPGAAGKYAVAKVASQLLNYVVRSEREDGTKEMRAGPFASQCEVGNVKLVQGAWNDAFLDELCSFPNAAHDDQVDAATAAFRCIADFANPAPLSGTQSHFR